MCLPDCGEPFRLRSDTEDSEQIEIDVYAYRRVIHRRRYERRCTCQGKRTLTAPPVPKLIPKSLYGTSIWVEIVLTSIPAIGLRNASWLSGGWETSTWPRAP